MSSPLILTVAASASTSLSPNSSSGVTFDGETSPNAPFSGMLQAYSATQKNTPLAQDLSQAIKALAANKKITTDELLTEPSANVSTGKEVDVDTTAHQEDTDNQNDALPVLALQILQEAKALKPQATQVLSSEANGSTKTHSTQALSNDLALLVNASEKQTAIQNANPAEGISGPRHATESVSAITKKATLNAAKEANSKLLAAAPSYLAASSSHLINSEQSAATSPIENNINAIELRAEQLGLPATHNLTQHTPVSSPAISTASAPLTEAVQLNKPDWPQQLGQHFIKLVSQDQTSWQSAEIRLDPPELGPLRISLHVQDGVAHALISSPHAQVRQTIEQSLSLLQQQLADNGLSLGQASVSDHGNSEQFQQSLADFAQQTGFQANRQADSSALEAAEGNTIKPKHTLALDALVDTYA